MSTTVHVTNIDPQTTEKDVRDFFSFCGKIASLKLASGEGKTQKAEVTFEKETAAKTALLLDNTQLGPAQVHVTGGTSTADSAATKTPDDEKHDQDHIAQEDKPRARIIAEYLAHGYVVSDKVIEQALAIDKQHGYTNKFTNTLKNFDQKYKATEKTQAVDQKYAVSARATAGWQGLASYFEQALETPTGQKLRGFYETGTKQVLDVHNEARHLANLKANKNQATPEKVEGSDRTKCSCAADVGRCGCAPGKCACSSCAKNPEEKTSSASAEEANPHKVSEAQTGTVAKEAASS